MRHQTEIIPAEDIARFIYSLRGERVMLDSDLARIYQVPTKALNQAVKRNRDKFPGDFVFEVSPSEVDTLQRLRSQIVTLKPGRGRHRKYLPHAFTEHGALMAATVLNSPQAVAMSVYIVRAFVKMREDLAANAAILKRMAEIDKTLLLHDTALREIFHKLRPLLEPPPVPPRPQIGFHVKEDDLALSHERMSKKLLRDRNEGFAHFPPRQRSSLISNTQTTQVGSNEEKAGGSMTFPVTGCDPATT
jgi:ORF6N domain-containing protein